MRRTRRLERLIRVRRAQRDRERVQRDARAAEAARAGEARDAKRETLDAGTGAMEEAARSGITRAWWRAAYAGLRQLRGELDAATDTVVRADSAEREAREKLVAARRRLRGAERLSERAQRDARRAAARAAQKRLDDTNGTRRGGAAAVCLSLLALSTASPVRAEVESAPNPGVAMLIGEVRVRQAELDTHAQELADREAHLQELEAEIAVRLDELQQLMTAVEERIANWETAHKDKQLSRLAKIYGSMEPRTAARLLEDLELDLATRIIAKMKHKQSAALLPLISQPRALAMSRSVAHPLGNPALPPENKP